MVVNLKCGHKFNQMKKLLSAIMLLIALVSFHACETDVDINAEWKEITIVYGLLNQLDTVHYFRINKAYLGGNALEVAKIEDSSSYKNNMEVRLEEWDGSDLIKSINFDTTTIYNKDTGVFYNPEMVVYKGVGELDPQYEYRLYARNKTTGHEVSASTRLIENFSISKPTAGGRLSFNKGYNTSFIWYNAANGKRYEPVVRFHYYEVPIDTHDTIEKYIDWSMTTQITDDASGYGESEVSVSNDGFYDMLLANIDPDFVGNRLVGPVDFIVSAGGEEYDTYMRVNGPSNSLVQDTPEYTNIENGYGIMSSRYQVVRTKLLSPLAEDEILDLGLSFVENPGL